MNAANALGFTEFTVMYYDIEYSNPNDVSCRNAVLAFLDGWTLTLHNNTRVSGAYTSAAGGINYWATIANVPDQIWFANYDGRTTVWFDPYINNSYWTGAQRHHQYVGNSTETWGGYQIPIDRNCANGLLAGSNTWGTPSYPPNYAGC